MPVINKKRSQKQTTQADRAAKLLIAIANNVTSSDKKDYKTKYGTSEATISRYLNVNVHDASEAIRMNKFFSKKISNREKELA